VTLVSCITFELCLIASCASNRLCFLARFSDISKKHGGPRGVIFDAWIRTGIRVHCCITGLLLVVFPFVQNLWIFHWPLWFGMVALRVVVVATRGMLPAAPAFFKRASLLKQHSNPLITHTERLEGKAGLLALLLDGMGWLALSASPAAELHQFLVLCMGMLAAAVVLILERVLLGQGGPGGSALRASLREKGENSYYYAHDKAVPLPSSSTSPSTPKLLQRSSPASPQQIRSKPIERYSFLDEGKKVKIYIELPPELQVSEESVQLDWTSTSLRVEVGPASGSHLLRVSQLHATIEACTLKVKPEKHMVILTLKKTGPEEWPRLAKEMEAVDPGICIDGR